MLTFSSSSSNPKQWKATLLMALLFGARIADVAAERSERAAERSERAIKLHTAQAHALQKNSQGIRCAIKVFAGINAGTAFLFSVGNWIAFKLEEQEIGLADSVVTEDAAAIQAIQGDSGENVMTVDQAVATGSDLEQPGQQGWYEFSPACVFTGVTTTLNVIGIGMAMRAQSQYSLDVAAWKTVLAGAGAAAVTGTGADALQALKSCQYGITATNVGFSLLIPSISGANWGLNQAGTLGDTHWNHAKNAALGLTIIILIVIKLKVADSQAKTCKSLTDDVKAAVKARNEELFGDEENPRVVSLLQASEQQWQRKYLKVLDKSQKKALAESNFFEQRWRIEDPFEGFEVKNGDDDAF